MELIREMKWLKTNKQTKSTKKKGEMQGQSHSAGFQATNTFSKELQNIYRLSTVL